MLELFSNILNYVLRLLTGASNEAPVYEKIIDLAFARLNEILNIVAYGFTGIVFIISGFLVTYFTLLSQYDRVGIIYLNAVAGGGLALTLIGFGILYNSTTRKVYEKKKIQKITNTTTPIEHALAALINDFVKEREFTRELSKKVDHEKRKQENLQDELSIH